MCTLTILKPLLVAFRRKLFFFEASGKVASRKLLSRKRFNTPSTMVTFNFFRRATPNCTAARFPRSQMRPACYRVCAHRHTRHRDNAQRVLASRTFRGVTVNHQVCCASYSLRTTRGNEAARLRQREGTNVAHLLPAAAARAALPHDAPARSAAVHAVLRIVSCWPHTTCTDASHFPHSAWARHNCTAPPSHARTHAHAAVSAVNLCLYVTTPSTSSAHHAAHTVCPTHPQTAQVPSSTTIDRLPRDPVRRPLAPPVCI